jgi:DNA-binding response OmpR family regulator
VHILLIEPDPLQARLYSTALERYGHTVARTNAAQSAIQLADEHTPDLVILELQLPGHNGVEFLYEFRSYPEWLGIPIIAHTFVSPHELTRTATLQTTLGVRNILYKPTTTLITLCQTVENTALMLS